MRLLTLFLTLLSVATGFTLHKTDGTTIELGDQPTIVDSKDVIRPEQGAVSKSSVYSISNATDVNTANTDFNAANVYFYDGHNYEGRRASAYLCRIGMRHCLVDDATTPWASSIKLSVCPEIPGSGNHGRPFGCFFFSTPVCDYTKPPYIYTRSSISDLAAHGWDNKIKALQCFFDKPPT